MKKRVSLFFAVFLLVFSLDASRTAIAAKEIRHVDLVEVTWANALPLSTNLNLVSSNIEDLVRPAWLQMTSFLNQGSDKSIQFNIGEVSSNVIRLLGPIPCDGAPFLSTIESIRTFFYSNLNLSDLSRRHLLIIMPKTSCLWIGKATSGGSNFGGGVLVLQDSSDSFVISHELGHNLGLGHSNLLRCDSGASDGPWGNDCQAIEYGGSIDVMGNVKTTSTLSTYHLWRLGIIQNESVYQSWKSEEIELSASDVEGKFRAVFIRDSGGAYWIEYRRPSSSTNFKSGLVILRTDQPSAKYIVTPNASEPSNSAPSNSVSSDYWMLNLDDYLYSQTGKSSGSMTLQKDAVFMSHSKKFTVSALQGSNPNFITVKITQKPDVNPPSAPSIRPQQTWSAPNDSIIDFNYTDIETIIVGFEGKIGDKIFSISGTSRYSPGENYLDPLTSEKTIKVGDLPEGKYEIQIRAMDAYGNRSNWSSKTPIDLDNTPPQIRSGAKLIGINQNKINISLTNISDSGSGICLTTLSNIDGFVFHSSDSLVKPNFYFNKQENLSFHLSSLDCAGNGSEGVANIKYKEVPLDKLKRTGNWKTVFSDGMYGLKCLNRCTSSITLSQDAFLVSDQELNQPVSSNKIELRESKKSMSKLNIIPISVTGSARKTFRISGTRFSIYALGQVSFDYKSIRSFKKMRQTDDLTLNDSNQKQLSKYGFSVGDFISDWQISPMVRGTTLEDPTLDLCYTNYISDRNRSARRQVVATKSISPYLFLSSEVVRYRSSETADDAYLELQAKVKECSANRGGFDGSGLFTSYQFNDFPKHSIFNSSTTKKIFVRTTIGSGPETRSLLGLYQFSKDMFSGIYVLKVGVNSFSDVEVLRWLDVASVIETRLTA